MKRTKSPKRKPPPGMTPVLVNIPNEMRAWLEKRAAEEYRSMTTIVQRALAAERAKTEQAEA
jgi:hypothetical protein